MRAEDGEESRIAWEADSELQGGFVPLPRAVLFSEDLSPGAIRLYSTLLHFAWDKGHCWPGQKHLAYLMNCSEGQVRRYLTELIETDFVRVERRGMGKSNMYYLRRLDRATRRYLEREKQIDEDVRD